MLEMMKGRLGGPIGAICGAGLIACAVMSPARAWDENIVRNCTDDYFSFCKAHSPESTELRYCMEAHRYQLSKQCVKALLDAGEVPRKYLTNSEQPKK